MSTIISTLLALEPVAPPPRTGILKSVSQLLLFTGAATLCVAFPPLRKKFVDAAHSVRNFFYEPAPILPRPEQQSAEKNTRREIDEFDMNLFN